jgi:uncharacterized protein (TIGR02147 family)
MFSTFPDILVSELASRKKINPAFSLRAFARVLELSPGQLSSIISGKKPITRKSAGKILKRLSLTSEDRRALLASIFPEVQGLAQMSTDSRQLREDELAVISDWYYFAILSLALVPNSRARAEWIADRLGITKFQALDALNRLKRLKLIRVEKDGRYRQTEKPLCTSVDQPSEAIRNHQMQNLDLAKEKLETVPLQRREFGTVTMAINSSRLARAKQILREFQDRISQELETGKADAVYTFAYQLFPVERIEGTE